MSTEEVNNEKSSLELREERKQDVIKEIKQEWIAKNGPTERPLSKQEIDKNKELAKLFGKEWDGNTTQLTEAYSNFYFGKNFAGNYNDSVPDMAEKILKERFPEYALAEKTSVDKPPIQEPEVSTEKEIKHLDSLQNTIKTGTEEEIQMEEKKISTEIINGDKGEISEIDKIKLREEMIKKRQAELKNESQNNSDVIKENEELEKELESIGKKLLNSSQVEERSIKIKEQTQVKIDLENKIKNINTRKGELAEQVKSVGNTSAIEEDNELTKELAAAEKQLSGIKTDFPETEKMTIEDIKVENKITETQLTSTEVEKTPIASVVEENTATPVTPIEGQLPPEKVNESLQLIAKMNADRKADLENGPLSLRLKNSTLNGLKAWENFGVEQKNEKGKVLVEGSFVKRMTKMAVNMALIGVISMTSVDQLAKHGAGTATALAGGIFSKLGTKLAVGLGIGAALDVVGNHTPAKYKKFMSKATPVLMGAIGITAATLMTGGGAGVVAGIAAGVGYLSTKFIKGNFTEEKIEGRKAEATKKLLAKYGKEDGVVPKEDIENLQKEYTKLLKHYENMGIYGKLLDEGTKILAGSVVSAAVMEVSGTISDHKTADIKAHDDAIKQHEAMQEKIEDIKEADAKILADTERIKMENIHAQQEAIKIEEAARIEAEQLKAEQLRIETENAENALIAKLAPTTPIEATFDDEPPVETATHISEIPHVTETPTNITHENTTPVSTIDNTPAHTPEPIDTTENHFKFDNNEHTMSVNENGVSLNIQFKYDANGHVEGIESMEGKISGPNPYANDSELTKLDELHQKMATSDLNEIRQNLEILHKLPSNTEEYKFLNEYISNKEHAVIEKYGNILNIDAIEKVSHGAPETTTPLNTPENATPTQRPETNSNTEHNTLSSEELSKLSEKAYGVFENNIKHMFPDEKSEAAWNQIRNSDASAIAKIPEEGALPQYQPLIHHIHDLMNIEGIEPPREAVGLTPAETLQEFLGRATIEAAKVEKLSEITL